MRNLDRDTFETFAQRLNPDSISVLSKLEKSYANHIDYFQFHYSRYLCGFVKTRHRTFEEYRALKQNPLFNESDYQLFLKEIEAFLLDREMYENLVLFVKTNKIIEKVKRSLMF